MSEHPGFEQMAWIENLNTRQNRAGRAVDFIPDVRYAAGEDLAGISVDYHIGVIADFESRQVVLEDAGEHPDAVKIDYRQWLVIIPVNHRANSQIASNQRSRDRRREGKFRNWMPVLRPIKRAEVFGWDK